MSDLKEYAIITKPGVDITDLDLKISISSSKDMDGYEYIPERAISSSHNFTSNKRITYYYLTAEEKYLLSQHPNILKVERKLSPEYYQTSSYQFGNYFQPFSHTSYEESASLINHGLVNHTTPGYFLDNMGLLGDNTSSFYTTYDYTLDGTGVDIVVIDISCYPDHFDFYTADGTRSRFNKINWPEYLNIPNDFNYSDIWYNNGSSAHGGRVLSIAAGQTYGWAKNAELYFVMSKNSNGDGANLEDAFTLIKLFHESKSIDPNTGFKRPTVVACSIGASYNANQFTSPSQINSINYKGSLTTYPSNNGIIGINQGLLSYDGKHPRRSLTLDTSLEEMIDAGVIFIHSAGNLYNAAYESGSLDDPYFFPEMYDIHYDNYYTYAIDTDLFDANEPIYYNRGTSPTCLKSIEVGAIGDTTYYSSEVYVIAPYSVKGGKIDTFATTRINAAIYDPISPISPYYKNIPEGVNNNFLRARSTGNGTSFAAPQVAGICALYCQINPGATALDFKNFLRTTYNPLSGSNDPTWRRNSVPPSGELPPLYGSPTRSLYWPYSSPTQVTFSNVKISKS